LERLESPNREPTKESFRELEEELRTVVSRIERRVKDLKGSSPDRTFSSVERSASNPVGSPSGELSSPKSGNFSSSLRAEDTDRRERREVEELSSTGRDNVSGRQRKLDTLQDDSDSYTAMRIKELRRLKMDLEEIRRLEMELLKNLPPREVLHKLGITNWQEKNGYILLNCPFREDKNPSFQIFYGTERNCWVCMDFGTGWIGSWIDLWSEIRGVDYVTAVREMREEFGINLLKERVRDAKAWKKELLGTIRKQEKEQAEERKRLAKEERKELKKLSFKVLAVKTPEHSALVKYLAERGIREIPEWLKEIHYLHLPTNKRYFALAVQDENGVWHARNLYSKVNILTAPDQSPTYTFIKRGKGNETVFVVEGLFDALTLNQRGKNKEFDIILLNSTTNAAKLIKDDLIRKQGYKRVILALDRDDAGQKAERELYDYLKQIEGVKIGRLTWSEGEDVNEAHMLKAKFGLEDITPKRYYIGKVYNGNERGEPVYRAVIGDNKQVLANLGAVKIREIQNAEDIAEYWEDGRLKGYVELYLKERAPEWIYNGLESSVWVERYKPVWATREMEEERKPTAIEHRKYFEVDGRIVLDREVDENPYEFVESKDEELREFAKQKLAEIERQKRLEEERQRQLALEEEDDDLDFGLGM